MAARNRARGAFSSVDSVVGRVARIDVFKGEVIVPGRLAPDGTGPGLEVKITPGKRAIAVRIDDVSGLNGLVQPNSRVDILVTLREGANGQQVSKLFMSNMRVLSIGTVSQTSVDNRPISAPTATIEVTPKRPSNSPSPSAKAPFSSSSAVTAIRIRSRPRAPRRPTFCRSSAARKR